MVAQSGPSASSPAGPSSGPSTSSPAGPSASSSAGSPPASEVRSSNGVRTGAFAVLVLLIVLAALVMWFRSESGPDLAWMAWTKPTAIFFSTIVTLLIGMATWEALSPGGGPRVGVLRFETTRGDRLFLSLLGAAFIQLAWLFFVGGPDLWPALGISLGWALLVFLFV